MHLSSEFLFTCKYIFWSILCPSLLDIDECTTGLNNCDVNATCTNTNGSYFCTCFDGYTGDGFDCERKILQISQIIFGV